MQGNILLVDDDTYASKVLKTILDAEGYTTYTATNLDEAITVVEERTLDLAIIDFFIPGCRGDLMAKVLKNINDNIQIIFLSGDEAVYEAVNDLSFSVCKIFIKPENIEELLSTIRSLFTEEEDPYRHVISHEKMVS